LLANLDQNWNEMQILHLVAPLVQRFHNGQTANPSALLSQLIVNCNSSKYIWHMMAAWSGMDSLVPRNSSETGGSGILKEVTSRPMNRNSNHICFEHLKRRNWRKCFRAISLDFMQVIQIIKWNIGMLGTCQ
jgi:hypothetical protein